MKCKQCQTKEINNYPNSQLCDTCFKRNDSRNQFRKDGKWSIYADQCKSCNSNQDPHKSWGFCNTCYQRNKRKLQREGQPIEKIREWFKKYKKVKVKRACEICGSTRLYSYGGSTELPVCFEHYYDWRKHVPCDGCGTPCTENAVDTEDDNGIVYWWHFKCWERACSTEQKEQLLALTTAS